MVNNTSEYVNWLGSEHNNKNKYNLFQQKINTDQVLAVNTAGAKENNEDSLKIVDLDQYGTLYMIADAHFGHSSSEIAVTKFPQILLNNLNSDSNDIQKTMYLSLINLDDYIRNNKPIDTNNQDKSVSETTFLVVLKKDNQVNYMSIGDSYLYKGKKNKMDFVNHKNHERIQIGPTRYPPIFLGSSYHKINETALEYLNELYKNKIDLSGLKNGENIPYDFIRQAIDIGSFKLKKKEELFLCSDGLEIVKGSNWKEIPINNIIQEIHNGLVHSLIKNYIHKKIKNAVKDNISFIYIR